MSASGACGLLFFAAKRSGAISTNVPAGLRARASRLGGFTRPFAGNCFPQLGPQLFVITGEAVTSPSRSSPIMMGWWSAQRNDYRSPLIEFANTTDSVKGGTKRGIIVQARTASQSIWGLSPTS